MAKCHLQHLFCLLGITLTCSILVCRFYLNDIKTKSAPLAAGAYWDKPDSRGEFSASAEITGNRRYQILRAMVGKKTPAMADSAVEGVVRESEPQFDDTSGPDQAQAAFPASDGGAIYITVSGGRVGRLGNRMFQYAAMIGLAKEAAKTGRRVIPFVDKDSHLNSLSDIFLLGGTESISVNSPVILLEDRAMTHCPRLSRQIHPGYNYTAMTFLQSWKYFANFSRDVRNEFRFKGALLKEAEAFLLSAANGSQGNVTLVGVHVRRGDFTTSHSQKRGYAPANAEYLRKALEYFRSEYPNVLFIVCSDDWGWSKKHVTGADVRHSLHSSPGVDLAILTLCEHTVVTSGTFGWWGAWLAGGHVVYYRNFPYPGSWLDSTCVREDYYPDSWIGLA